MSTQAALWEEFHADAMHQADCWHLYEQMTPEQQAKVGEMLARCAEGEREYSPANHGGVPNREEDEKQELRRLLDIEKRKVQCDTCRGTGVERSLFMGRLSTSTCHKCHGEGKHLP